EKTAVPATLAGDDGAAGAGVSAKGVASSGTPSTAPEPATSTPTSEANGVSARPKDGWVPELVGEKLETPAATVPKDPSSGAVKIPFSDGRPFTTETLARAAAGPTGVDSETAVDAPPAGREGGAVAPRPTISAKSDGAARTRPAIAVEGLKIEGPAVLERAALASRSLEHLERLATERAATGAPIGQTTPAPKVPGVPTPSGFESSTGGASGERGTHAGTQGGDGAPAGAKLFTPPAVAKGDAELVARAAADAPNVAAAARHKAKGEAGSADRWISGPEALDGTRAHSPVERAAAVERSGAGAIRDVEVIRQVTEAAGRARSVEGGTLTLRLNPADLGNVQVKLDMVAGRLTATLTVERADVRSALERGLGELHTALAGKGVDIQHVRVEASPSRDPGPNPDRAPQHAFERESGRRDGQGQRESGRERRREFHNPDTARFSLLA
ncbi:MAG: flagellar hook-length control protein FliK, partial [Myxococcales bacterium]|nr:flagellar hook-length control protein FliK [Myxococcales bacterium]